MEKMNGEREKSEYEMKIRFDTILWNNTSRKKERTPHFSWIFSSMLFFWLCPSSISAFFSIWWWRSDSLCSYSFSFHHFSPPSDCCFVIWICMFANRMILWALAQSIYLSREPFSKWTSFLHWNASKQSISRIAIEDGHINARDATSIRKYIDEDSVARPSFRIAEAKANSTSSISSFQWSKQ